MIAKIKMPVFWVLLAGVIVNKLYAFFSITPQPELPAFITDLLGAIVLAFYKSPLQPGQSPVPDKESP